LFSSSNISEWKKLVLLPTETPLRCFQQQNCGKNTRFIYTSGRGKGIFFQNSFHFGSGMAAPEPEEGATVVEHINLKVLGQDGNVVQFKIKQHTVLRKLMSTYCERIGVAPNDVRFSFDGDRVNEGDTPRGLKMEDGDTIEVFQQQTGGSARE
jgi:small ubiquitin-related modifier